MKSPELALKSHTHISSASFCMVKILIVSVCSASTIGNQYAFNTINFLRQRGVDDFSQSGRLEAREQLVVADIK